MNIKNRLALNFTLISTGLLLIVLCSVYVVFLKFLETDFYERLSDRTMVTAKLYLEADEISRDALNKVRSQYMEKLSDEITRIYDSNDQATFIGDGAQYWTKETINKVRKNGKIRFKEGERQVVGVYYKDNQGDFVILASATDQSSHNRLAKLFKIMLATFLLFTMLLLLLSRWIAKKILRPLQFFMEEVRQVGLSNLALRVSESGSQDEIDQLAQSFNQLMEELEQAFILQKTFVSNASHELRTPVTRVMMSAELALSKERDIPSYKAALESVLEDSERINSIITGLLTLAKADLELAATHLAPLDLLVTMNVIKDEWLKQGFELKLVVAQEDGNYTILANNILLQIAINNIIANAYKFSANKSVECRLESSQGTIMLAITDQGVGMEEAELLTIFDAFYSNAKVAGATGEGMGLYMASKIINLFKGEIKVISTVGAGSTFKILLSQL